MSAHLVRRMKDMSASLPKPRLGEWDVPSLLTEAAEEIERLRLYAIKLECGISCPSLHPNAIDVGREETQVNWMAIHGVSP